MVHRRRNAKGRFIKGKANPVRRHKTGRKRVIARAAASVNPRRRRHARRGVAVSHRRKMYASNPRRHRKAYKRNPGFLSGLMSGNTLKDVAFVAGGFLGTPFVEGFILAYIPTVTDATMKKLLNYGVRIGSAWGLSWGVGKIAGPQAARQVLIGGLAYTAVTILKDTGLLGSGTVGNYRLTAGRGVGAQPLLGKYAGFGSPMTTHTADRLNPANRF